MTIIFEIDPPLTWKPGKYESELMTRYWWLCFAVCVLKVPFREFCETPMRWEKNV